MNVLACLRSVVIKDMEIRDILRTNRVLDMGDSIEVNKRNKDVVVDYVLPQVRNIRVLVGVRMDMAREGIIREGVVFIDAYVVHTYKIHVRLLRISPIEVGIFAYNGIDRFHALEGKVLVVVLRRVREVMGTSFIPYLRILGIQNIDGNMAEGVKKKILSV